MTKKSNAAEEMVKKRLDELTAEEAVACIMLHVASIIPLMSAGNLADAEVSWQSAHAALLRLVWLHGLNMGLIDELREGLIMLAGQANALKSKPHG